ncbi:hypothetical protein AMQ84_25795 [Paenibacillus riograndensis]|uniref:Uncharacterized protein n=1 Tax=Paenibacillus riograndensis TaxID=483937 RepID=A0A132TLQ6_9BACL|nr:hypothetical protein AMQ84_25795 [Paenibacillus riograndensis]
MTGNCGECLDFRPLPICRFLDLNRCSRWKSADKGGRFRSSSSKLPLRYFHLQAALIFISGKAFKPQANAALRPLARSFTPLCISRGFKALPSKAKIRSSWIEGLG